MSVPERGDPDGVRRRLCGFERRRPVASAVALAAAWLIPTLVGFFLLGALAPSWSGTRRAFVVLVVLAALVAWVVTALRWWPVVGYNRPAAWRDLHLLWLPAVLVVLPVVGGFDVPAIGALAFLVAGYALTGFAEETFFRGVMLRVLAPTGPMRAAVVSSLLFGAVHLGNVFYRDNAAIVVAQAVGAACAGFGWAALRLRTNTIWPLLIIHMFTDLLAAVARLPAIPFLVVEDVILLVYGLVLIRRLSPALVGEPQPATAVRPDLESR